MKNMLKIKNMPDAKVTTAMHTTLKKVEVWQCYDKDELF